MAGSGLYQQSTNNQYFLSDIVIAVTIRNVTVVIFKLGIKSILTLQLPSCTMSSQPALTIEYPLIYSGLPTVGLLRACLDHNLCSEVFFIGQIGKLPKFSHVCMFEFLRWLPVCQVNKCCPTLFTPADPLSHFHKMYVSPIFLQFTFVCLS